MKCIWCGKLIEDSLCPFCGEEMETDPWESEEEEDGDDLTGDEDEV